MIDPTVHIAEKGMDDDDDDEYGKLICFTQFMVKIHSFILFSTLRLLLFSFCFVR